MLQAVENYNLGSPSCNPSAFLVLGSPGSGKSCFVGRLMMEMLDRYENLIPLMLPVADLVKRSDPEGISHIISQIIDVYEDVTCYLDMNMSINEVFDEVTSRRP